MGERFETRDGRPLLIRPIEAADRRLLHDAFMRLSPEARYKRFFSPIRDLSPTQLTALTEVDHIDHEAFVALTEEGELVGVARFIRLADRPSAAEVAVTVADAWHQQGIGTALLIRLTERAAALGVSAFVATCLADNREMLTVFRDLPGVECAHGDPLAGVVEVEIALPTGDPSEIAPALGHGARAFRAAGHPVVGRSVRG